MKNRTLPLTAAALLASSVLVLSGCASTTEAAAPGAEAGPEGLATPGVLSHCVSLSYPPLEFYENGSSGEITGWDIDSAAALGDLFGVETKVTAMNFDGLIPSLDTGKCDIIWSGMYINEARTQVTDATPVLRTGSEIVALKKIAGKIEKPEDLCGLNIAAQVASEDLAHLTTQNEECEAAGLPKIEISAFPGTLDAIPTVRDGRIDALIDTSVLAAEIARTNDDLVVVPGLFESDYWFGAFTKKGSPLASAVKEGLTTLAEDGTLITLAEKYGLNPDNTATAKDIASVSTAK